MRFVDASLFLYAYLKPRKVMSDEAAEVKQAAKTIVRRINSGEKVETSLTHLSEVANILEASMPIQSSHLIMHDLIHSPTISLLEPTKDNYVDAIQIAEEANVGLNDAVACVLMKENEIEEIYSFDKRFDRFEDARRVHE